METVEEIVSFSGLESLGLTPAQSLRQAANAAEAKAKRDALEAQKAAKKAAQALPPDQKRAAIAAANVAHSAAVKSANTAHKSGVQAAQAAGLATRADVAATRKSTAQAKKDARIAKRLANGQTVAIPAAEGPKVDAIQTQIASLKSKLAQAKSAVKAAKTPSDRAAAKALILSILAELGSAQSGGLKGFSGFGDYPYRGGSSSTPFGWMGDAAAPPPLPAMPPQCARRPNSPICLFYTLSVNSQQQMQFFMSQLMDLQQQLMDLIATLAANDSANTATTGAPVYGVDAFGNPLPIPGAYAGDGSGGQFMEPGSAYQPNQMATNGAGAADVLDLGMNSENVPGASMQQQYGSAQSAQDAFSFASEIPGGAYQQQQYAAAMPVYSMDQAGGMGPVAMDPGASGNDLEVYEDGGAGVAFERSPSSQTSAEQIIDSADESVDSFAMEGENSVDAQGNGDEQGFDFSSNDALSGFGAHRKQGKRHGMPRRRAMAF